MRKPLFRSAIAHFLFTPFGIHAFLGEPEFLTQGISGRFGI
jgi:hypothetical protein